MLQSPVDHSSPSSGPSNLTNAREEVNRFAKLLMRTKTIASQRSLDDPDENSEADQGLEGGHLQKVLTTSDLTSLGVGSCCGTGMYVVAGFVAKTIAGPAVIVSFMIAAVASILSGVCYGEFGVRVPKTTGSAYMYSYVAVGEFIAFLLGWNMILEYVIGSAAGASAISVCFDALTNHTMSVYLEEHIGTVIGKSYPDFLGFGVCLSMTVILASGVRGSVRFNNVLNAVNFVVWIFIIVAGLFYVRAENWTQYGFAPYGATGIFKGAATCFYAFIGFDIIGTTGEEAKNPSRSIPIAIVSSLFICLFAYASVSVILTLMVPYVDIEPGSALVDMFVQRDFYSAKWIVAIGAIAALVVSLLGSMFPMPRIIYAMSRDGLLFEFLGRINLRTGTPLVATVVTGSLASFMSLLVSLEILIEMMSIGTLLAYSLVSMSVLILRYQPDKHDIPIPMAHRIDPETTDDSPQDSYDYDDYGLSDPDAIKRRYKDDQYLIPAVDDHKSYGSVFGRRSMGAGSQGIVESKMATVRRHAKIVWLRLGFPGDDLRPNDRTARTAILFSGLLCLSEAVACLLIVFGGGRMENGEVWVVLLLLVAFVCVVGCLVVILRQPQNKGHDVQFKAPAVPFLPACAVFVNLYLALNLPVLTWARLGVWICIGLLLYFGYSMVHSVKGRKEEEKKAADHNNETEKQQTEMEKAVSGSEYAPSSSSSLSASSSLVAAAAATAVDQTMPADGKTSDENRPRRPPPPRQESLSKLKSRSSSTTSQDGGTADHDQIYAGQRSSQSRRTDMTDHHGRITGSPTTSNDSERQRQNHQTTKQPISKETPSADYSFAKETGNRSTKSSKAQAHGNRNDEQSTNYYAPRPRPRPGQTMTQVDPWNQSPSHHDQDQGQGQMNRQNTNPFLAEEEDDDQQIQDGANNYSKPKNPFHVDFDE